MLSQEKHSLPDNATEPPEDIPSSVEKSTEAEWNRSELAKLVGLNDDDEGNSSIGSSSDSLSYSESADSSTESPDIDPDLTQGNVLGADELFDDPHLAATPKTVAKSPFAKLGLVAGGLGVVFLLAGLVLNGVMGAKGDLTAKPAAPTPTPTVDAQKQQENSEGQLKTELALSSQSDELKQLDEAKKNQKKQAVSPTDPKRQKGADGKTPPGNQTTASASTSSTSAPARTPPPARVSSPPPPPPARVSSPPVAPAPVAQARSSPPPPSFSQVAAAAPVAPLPSQRPVSASVSATSSRSAQTASPTAVATPRSAEGADPIAQWQTLASLGSYSASPSVSLEDQAGDQVSQLPVASQQPAATPVYSVQRSQQSQQQQPQQQQLSSPKTQSVSYSQPLSQPSSPPQVSSQVSPEQRLLDGIPYRVAPAGAMTDALLVTPLVLPAAESKGQLSASADGPHRVLVSLVAPLTDLSGQTLLPAGTSLVFEVKAVDSNGVINAVAVSQLDSTGMERSLPPDSLVLTGAEGSPLIAKSYFDDGGTIASMDLSSAALGALGKVGEILNRPKEQSSSSISGGTSSQTTTSTTGEPNLLGAVLEGGATPVLQQIMKRNDRAIQDIQQRKNLWFLEPQTTAQIMVTRSFELN
jgi:hypothetical protein